jgi:hypothetical protein
MGHREFLLCDNKLAQITSAVGSATRECVRRKAASFKSAAGTDPFVETRAFIGTNPADEPITSGLPLISSEWQGRGNFLTHASAQAGKSQLPP